MKEGILMRVLIRKIHCTPFMCFCKPSAVAAAAHRFYSSGPLKLENKPQFVVPEISSNSDDVKEAKNVLKSCLRKVPSGTDDKNNTEVREKKTVQWIDVSGKQLAAIKEFKSSETGDTDSEEESSRCLCVIL